MGVKTIYSCDEAGCREQLILEGTGIHSDPTNYRWVIKRGIGGSKVICPKHANPFEINMPSRVRPIPKSVIEHLAESIKKERDKNGK